jgi:hypothetical protein
MCFNFFYKHALKYFKINNFIFLFFEMSLQLKKEKHKYVHH